MKPIIRVQNLSKLYRIGGRKAAYGTLRDTLTEAIRAPFRGRDDQQNGEQNLWALKDINLEIGPGEVLGLVGRNGAGKSTLLKVLSRITEPTTGRVELFGRVGSLLEVGTGFHGELTGRENILLSGAILGMKRADINRKFDEIVAFSEIEKFLDTPVKRYSSGMYVRLAFSVAAHMEPEILLVDEVLAVGDASFQKKCLDHMRRLKQSGTTILLVSHNLAAIQSTCERSIFLHDGQVAGVGPSETIARQYRETVRKLDEHKVQTREQGQEADPFGLQITGFDIFGADGVSRRNFAFGEEVKIRVDVFADRRVETPLINFGLRRGDGVIVCNFNNWFDNFKIDYLEGQCRLEGWLPPLRLIPHYYEIYIHVWQRLSNSGRADLARLQPLAMSGFGDFHIEGPPLTDQDGVFQMPAKKWVLTRGDEQIEFSEMNNESLAAAFNDEGLRANDTLVDRLNN